MGWNDKCHVKSKLVISEVFCFSWGCEPLELNEQLESQSQLTACRAENKSEIKCNLKV